MGNISLWDSKDFESAGKMSKWMFDMPKLRLNLSESWNFPKFPLSSSNCCCLVLSSALAFAEAAPFDYFCAAAAIYLYCNLKGQSNCFCNSTRLTRDQILNSTAQDMHIGFQTHLCLSLPTALFYSSQSKDTRCLKITENVSFNIASDASYVYNLSG